MPVALGLRRLLSSAQVPAVPSPRCWGFAEVVFRHAEWVRSSPCVAAPCHVPQGSTRLPSLRLLSCRPRHSHCPVSCAPTLTIVRSVWFLDPLPRSLTRPLSFVPRRQGTARGGLSRRPLMVSGLKNIERGEQGEEKTFCGEGWASPPISRASREQPVRVDPVPSAQKYLRFPTVLALPSVCTLLFPPVLPAVSESELLPHPVSFARSFPVADGILLVSRPVRCLTFLLCLPPARCLQTCFRFPSSKGVAHPRSSPADADAQSSITATFLETLTLSHWLTPSLPCQFSGLTAPLKPLVLHRVSLCDIYL